MSGKKIKSIINFISFLLIFILICYYFFFKNTYFNFFSGQKKIDFIQKVTGNEYLVNIKLPTKSSGWDIVFFNSKNYPLHYDSLLKSLKNQGLLKEEIIVRIMNKGANELSVGRYSGESIQIKPDEDIIWYAGSLKGLFEEGPICCLKNESMKINAVLIIYFQTKDIIFDEPIPIIAQWQDAL